MAKNEYWIVETDYGIIFADEEAGTKKFWISGSPSRVFVPVFSNKEDAKKFQRRIRRSKNISWTRLVRAKIIMKNSKSEEDKKLKFMKIFANIPEKVRSEDIIAVADDKPFTWNTAMIEIKNDTETGKKILKILEKIGVL